MNKHRNYTAEEVASILMASDGSDEEKVFDVAENELISDEEVDNVEIEAFEDDSDVSSDSESSNASELESDHDADEIIYTGKDNTKWRSTAPSAAAYRRHNIIYVRPGLTGWVAGFEDQLPSLHQVWSHIFAKQKVTR